ncbi:RICIN domain-containing protein [Streptomyces youssoufiensis]
MIARKAFLVLAIFVSATALVLGAGPTVSAESHSTRTSVTLQASDAQKSGPYGWYSLENIETGSCIDDSYEAGLRGYGCHFQKWQRFFVERKSNGYYYLGNEATQSCIDDSYQFGLRGHPCNNSPYQEWHLYETATGIALQNRATGSCIDDSYQHGLRGYACNGNNHQSFAFWQEVN